MQEQRTKERLVEDGVAVNKKLLHKTQWLCGSLIFEICTCEKFLKGVVLRGSRMLYDRGLNVMSVAFGAVVVKYLSPPLPTVVPRSHQCV